jgi:hypothetical protein
MRKLIIWTTVLGSLAWMMLVYAIGPADAAKSTCQVKAAACESGCAAAIRRQELDVLRLCGKG